MTIRENLIVKIKPVRKALFPVAGLGTRFLPATKALPKEMIPIVDKPLIQYAVEEAKNAGIEQFIFVTGRSKSIIENHFDYTIELDNLLKERGKSHDLKTINDFLPIPGQMAFLRQQKPLGLGHAVWCGRNLIGNEPFAVILPDDLILAEPGCLQQMVEEYNQLGGNIVAVEDVPKENTERYGILEVETDDGRLVTASGVVEKPKPVDAPSTLSIVGRYILQPEVFDHLQDQKRGTGNEVQLTDAIAKIIKNAPLHGLRLNGKRFDCGNKLGFIEANIAISIARSDLSSDVKNILREYL